MRPSNTSCSLDADVVRMETVCLSSLQSSSARCSLDADVVRMETCTTSGAWTMRAIAVHSTQMSCGWKHTVRIAPDFLCGRCSLGADVVRMETCSIAGEPADQIQGCSLDADVVRMET